MTAKKLTDLTGLKETQEKELAGMGIKSVSELAAALQNEDKVKEIVKNLSGIGPKTVMRWKSELEGAEASAEKKPVKDIDSTKAKEAHKKVGKEIEQAETDKKEAAKKEKAAEKKQVIAKKAGRSLRGKSAKTEPAEKETTEVVEDAEQYVPSIKPVLDDETTDGLAKRAIISGRRPAFKRQEWFRYAKLGESWRRPKGIHSKMKRNLKRRAPVVDIGYRGPASVRGLHPSGFEEVMVYNVEDLEKIDPKVQAARIGGTVGTKKRAAIQDRAAELKIRVLNRMV